MRALFGVNTFVTQFLVHAESVQLSFSVTEVGEHASVAW